MFVLDERNIAAVVINGGYFLINGTAKIFVTDVEFYFHSERNEQELWKKDFCMYHRGTKEEVPYFPVGSICPHNSGVDVSFENPFEEYRASFLVRGHRYEDGKETYETDKPTYLRENMFGYSNCISGGLNIRWIDDRSCPQNELTDDTRVNVSKYDENGKSIKGEKDLRRWRFRIKRQEQ